MNLAWTLLMLWACAGTTQHDAAEVCLVDAGEGGSRIEAMAWVCVDDVAYTELSCRMSARAGALNVSTRQDLDGDAPLCLVDAVERVFADCGEAAAGDWTLAYGGQAVEVEVPNASVEAVCLGPAG